MMIVQEEKLNLKKRDTKRNMYTVIECGKYKFIFHIFTTKQRLNIHEMENIVQKQVTVCMARLIYIQGEHEIISCINLHHKYGRQQVN